MLTLRVAKSAAKAFARMPGGIARRSFLELAAIASHPTAYPGLGKPLQGSVYWRLRVGEWREICETRNQELVLLVVKVATREDAGK